MRPNLPLSYKGFNKLEKTILGVWSCRQTNKLKSTKGLNNCASVTKPIGGQSITTLSNFSINKSNKSAYVVEPMINSAGLGGIGPEGMTHKLLMPVSNITSSKVALPLKKLLNPMRLPMAKCLATLGLRKSLSINTVVCPVNE